MFVKSKRYKFTHLYI